MGIQLTETKSLNTGADLPKFKLGLCKIQKYHKIHQLKPNTKQ